MTHVEFACHLLRYSRKNFCDGILTLGLLAEHIFRTWLLVQTHRGDTGALLSSVVLFLHHQIELIKSISPRTIFLFVVIQRLQQANHRYATLMF